MPDAEYCPKCDAPLKVGAENCPACGGELALENDEHEGE